VSCFGSARECVITGGFPGRSQEDGQWPPPPRPRGEEKEEPKY
jgi:hypothetical protein